MAKFNALLRSLARPPAFQQGLFDAARGIGATPVMLGAQRQAEEERQRQQQVNRLVASGETMEEQARALAETRRSQLLVREAVKQAQRSGDFEALRALGLGALDPKVYLTSKVGNQKEYDFSEETIVLNGKPTRVKVATNKLDPADMEITEIGMSVPDAGDTTNITVDMREARETKLQEELGTQEAKAIGDTIQAGREAAQVLPRYAQARAIMESSGDDITGFGAGVLLDARKLVQATYNAFGVNPNDSVRSALDRNVADAELITAFQQDFVTGRLAATKGAISDAEFKAFLASVPGLMTSKEGYISMLNFLEKAAVRAEIKGDYFRMDIPDKAGASDFKRADKMWEVFSSQFPAGNENTAGIPKDQLRQMWNQFRIKNTNEKGLPKQQITALDPKEVSFFVTNEDGELQATTLADLQKEAIRRRRPVGTLLQEMYANPNMTIQFAPPVEVAR